MLLTVTIKLFNDQPIDVTVDWYRPVPATWHAPAEGGLEEIISCSNPSVLDYIKQFCWFEIEALAEQAYNEILTDVKITQYEDSHE